MDYYLKNIYLDVNQKGKFCKYLTSLKHVNFFLSGTYTLPERSGWTAKEAESPPDGYRRNHHGSAAAPPRQHCRQRLLHPPGQRRGQMNTSGVLNLNTSKRSAKNCAFRPPSPRLTAGGGRVYLCKYLLYLRQQLKTQLSTEIQDSKVCPNQIQRISRKIKKFRSKRNSKKNIRNENQLHEKSYHTN
jgi:hypothetical protein